MSFDALGELNWLAVVAATVAYFMLGALWYSPAFLGKPWMKASGMEMEDAGQGPGPIVFLAPFIFSFVASIANGMLALATGSDSLSEGLVLGLVVGVGYATTIVGVTAVFESKKPDPTVWGAITAGYHLFGLMLSAAIVSAWG
jgi:hypothetical protein